MKTSSGFEFEIIGGVFDDWELIELLAELGEGNGLKLPAVVKKLLGDEQAAALKEHCRDRRSGKVTVKAMNAEIAEIITLSGKKKN